MNFVKALFLYLDIHFFVFSDRLFDHFDPCCSLLVARRPFISSQQEKHQHPWALSPVQLNYSEFWPCLTSAPSVSLSSLYLHRLFFASSSFFFFSSSQKFNCLFSKKEPNCLFSHTARALRAPSALLFLSLLTSRHLSTCYVCPSVVRRSFVTSHWPLRPVSFSPFESLFLPAHWGLAGVFSLRRVLLVGEILESVTYFGFCFVVSNTTNYGIDRRSIFV